VLATYLLLFCQSFLHHPKNLLLLLVLMVSFIALTELQASAGLFPIQVIPYVMLLLLLRIFFGSHLALNAYLITILIAAYFVPAEPLAFIFIQVAAGFTALFSLQSLTSRGQIIKAAFIVYLIYIGASMIIQLIHEDSITSDYWIQLLYYGINLIFLMFSYILAFVIGVALTTIEGRALRTGFEEFRDIVNLVISKIIIPLLPIYIFGIFLNMTQGGQVLTQTKRHPTLEDNVTVGAGAKVLGPITIGEGSAIGANAVVTKDVPANHIAVGIPAKSRPRKSEECIKLVDPDAYVVADYSI